MAKRKVAQRKKRRSFLKTWAIAVTTGTFLIGSGVFLGLESASRQGDLALNEVGSSRELAPLVDSTNPIDTSAGLDSGDVGAGDEVIVLEGSVDEDIYSRTETTIVDDTPLDSDTGGTPMDVNYTGGDDTPTDVENPSDADESLTPKRGQPRAPAPSPSAAVRLATGEQIILPADGRIDRYLASRGDANSDAYEIKTGVGPEYYQPRPTD